MSDYDGAHFQLRGPVRAPAPSQHPHPPIVIGGSDPNRTLRSVARYADHWNHPAASVDDWRRSLDVLHQRCAEIDRDPVHHHDVDPRPGDWSNPAPWSTENAPVGRHQPGASPSSTSQAPHTPEHLPAVAEALAPLATGT